MLTDNFKLKTTDIKLFFIENQVVFWCMLGLFIKQLLYNWYIWQIPLSLSIFRLIISSLVTSVLLFLPVLFLPKYKFGLALGLNIFLSLAIFGDLAYLRYFDAFPTVSLLSALGQNTGSFGAITWLTMPWDFLLFLDIVLFIIFRKRLGAAKPLGYQKGLRYSFAFTTFALLLILGLGLYDQGKIREAATKASNDKFIVNQFGAIGAHFFDFYRNFFVHIPKLNASEKSKLLTQISANTFKQADNQFTGISKGKNIIVIQVESLQSFVIDKKVEGQEITPNLNKLLGNSHYFNNHYFEIGAGGTSDVDFSANTSIYPLPDESAFIKYGKEPYTSIAKALKSDGYSVDAYHANNRGFWNRIISFASLGFDKFFAEDNYPKGERIDMGLNDMDFFDKTADYLQSQTKPSFSYLITLSSHFPFEIKDPHRKLKLTENKYPAVMANYLESVNYTDEAIGHFLDKLKAEGLYEDSTIVVYGDHYAKLEDTSYKGFTYDTSHLDDRQVPLFIKLPGQNAGVLHTEVTGHLDIMPTVLNLAGVKTSFPMFGRDLFGNTKPFFAAVSYFGKDLAEDDHYLYHVLDDGTASCTDISTAKSKKVANSKCNYLVNEKNAKQDASNAIIKYNLFPSWL